MRKGIIKSICGLVAFCVFFLGGCGDSGILAEKLQTAALEREITRLQTCAEESRYPVESFLYEEAGCFAYQGMNEAERIWYDNIAEALGLMQEEIRLDAVGLEHGMDETDIDRIFQCVLMDHPELFYVEGYTYRKYTREEETVAILFSGTYSMQGQHALARQDRIDAEVEKLLAGAEGLADEYEKVKYVYETLIRSTEYDLEAPDNQNIYSVFVNHKSVCQGYAKAAQYLLERMGMECALVLGTVDTGEGHAWNLVKVNGSYYYVDTTWGDASYQSGEAEVSENYVPEISYDYLCVTTEQLLRTHILGGYVSMPLCVETKDNYYVRENALFTTYDRAQLQAVFDRFYEAGNQEVTIQCTDEEVFCTIRNALVEEQEIFDYLQSGQDHVIFTHNEKQLSMTFWVTNE